MSNYSRHNETRSRKVPHKKRTISMRGSGDDTGKWFRCWNCNFPNNIDRSVVGDGEGLSYSLGIIDNDIVSTGTQAHKLGVSGTVSLMGPGSTKNNIGSEAVSGCSFCGSKNYR